MLCHFQSVTSIFLATISKSYHQWIIVVILAFTSRCRPELWSTHLVKARIEIANHLNESCQVLVAAPSNAGLNNNARNFVISYPEVDAVRLYPTHIEEGIAFDAVNKVAIYFSIQAEVMDHTIQSGDGYLSAKNLRSVSPNAFILFAEDACLLKADVSIETHSIKRILILEYCIKSNTGIYLTQQSSEKKITPFFLLS